MPHTETTVVANNNGDKRQGSGNTPAPEIQELVTQFNTFLNHSNYLDNWVRTGERVLGVLTRFLPDYCAEGSAARDGMITRLAEQLGKREYQVFKLIKTSRAIRRLLSGGHVPRTMANVEVSSRCMQLTMEMLRPAEDRLEGIRRTVGSGWLHDYVSREELEELGSWGFFD